MVAAIAAAISRVTGTKVDNGTLPILIIFSLGGLAISLLAIGLGLDVSWAFF
jgi:hypothetical protein